jgi:hypothetical protein
VSKKNPIYLLVAGCFVLFVQLWDLYIIIMPVRDLGYGPDLRWIWLDIACLATIVIPLVLLFLHAMSRRALFPARDPRIIECIKCSN